MSVDSELSVKWFVDASVQLVFPETERERERRRIAILILPFGLLALFSGVIPIWEMMKISVSQEKFRTTGFTLVAYERLLTEPFYRNLMINTLWFAVATTIGSILVAIPVAHALEKYDIKFERAIVTVISFPNSLPGIVVAFMILVLMGNNGLLTNFLAALSGTSPFDLAMATSVVGLFFGYLYTMVPRALLLLRGTYAEVNVAAEEAARSLGATPLKTFWYVTLQQIKPGVVGSLILLFRTALAIFGTVLILKGLIVWTLQINRELTAGFNIRMAAAMATVWFVFVLLFTFAGLQFTSAEVEI